jgi:dTDP-4-amino-4,6-dideoxygalactose transaminase
VRDPRRAYRVVVDFEDEIEDYTGAPFAVTVDSCTNALHLALLYERLVNWHKRVTLPKRTYVGVMQAALNAGYVIDWDSADWHDSYRLAPTAVIDSARLIPRAGYQPSTLTCLSFHAAKQLPLGRGGAILTDSAAAYQWLRRARTDGRAPGDTSPYATFPGHHMYMPPDTAARGLWILSRYEGREFAPLPPDPYPDLSAITNEAPSKPAGASPALTIVKP